MENAISYSSVDPLYANDSLRKANAAFDRKEILTGTATLSSGDFINIGRDVIPQDSQVTLLTSGSAYPTVYPCVSNEGSGGLITVRFTNLSDGSANTSGTFTVNWMCAVPSEPI
jgi:hypothetical protein